MAKLTGITQADPGEFTARLGGESVTVVFDNARMTGRWERDVKRAAENDDTEALFDVFSRVFISWDVVDEQGQPVPLTADLLLDMPARVITSLLDGMREAAVPGEAEGNASPPYVPAPLSATSEKDSQSSPNGSETSTSPTPSASLSSS